MARWKVVAIGAFFALGVVAAYEITQALESEDTGQDGTFPIRWRSQPPT